MADNQAERIADLEQQLAECEAENRRLEGEVEDRAKEGRRLIERLAEAQQVLDRYELEYNKTEQARQILVSKRALAELQRDTLRGLLREAHPFVECSTRCGKCNRCQIRERITAALKEVEG